MKINVQIKKLTAVAMCLMFTISACDKKDDPVVTPEPPTQPTPPKQPENPTPNFTDGKGTLSAVKSRTFQNLPIVGTTTIDLGLAVAVFYDNPEDSTYKKAGTVTCNASNLKAQDNNGYVYTPSQTDSEGIKFSDSNDEVTWDISGSSEVSAFTEVFSGPFPEIMKLSSSEVVKRTENYTLSSEGITGADSSLFMVGGIYHTVAGSVNSYTFSSTELSTLSEGMNFVQIASWTVESRTVNGEKYHFVKETVVTQSVTIK